MPGETFAGVPAPYIPMSVSGVSPTKKTPLAPPHIPILTGTDCSACHGAAYQAGGFGPATAMSAAKHAFVSTTCDTCHDTGKSFYVGTGTPLQLRPADHVNSSDPRHGHRRLLAVPRDQGLGQHRDAGRAHAESQQLGLRDVPRLRAERLHAGDSGRRPRCCTPESPAIADLCHGNTRRRAHLGQQLHAQGCRAHPRAHPVSVRDRLQLLPRRRTYVAGGFGPMNMSAAKHAFVPTACDTCHEAGPELLHGRGELRRCRAARPTTSERRCTASAERLLSLCHTTANWNSTVMPAGHMPNPGNPSLHGLPHRGAGKLHAATLASIAVLHTRHQRRLRPVPRRHRRSSPSTTTTTTPRTRAHACRTFLISAGTDCSSCHAANYVAGGFGPTNMTAAKHAFVPTTCDTCHEAGLTFFSVRRPPRCRAGPPTTPDGTAQQQTGDCSVPHHRQLGHHGAAGRPHAEPWQSELRRLPHRRAHSTELRDASGHRRPAHRASAGTCGQCHGAPRQLTFYNNNDNPKGRGAGPPAHIPYLTGRTAAPATPRTMRWAASARRT